MSYILKRDQYVKSKLIKEGSGPLGNDINWGDSLVGRLLFSIFRAVQLGVDKGKVKWYLGKLEDVLKNPLFEDVKNDENWKNGVRIIRNGAAEDTLSDTIEENPEKLEDLLEGWKEDMGEDWLKKFLEDLGAEHPELLAIIQKLIEGQTGDKKGTGDGETKTYSIMVSNLTHLKAVIDNMNNVKLEGDPGEKKSASGKYYNFQGKEGRGICYVISQTDEGGVYAAIWKGGKWKYSLKGAFISAKNLLKEIPVDRLSINKVTPYIKPTQKELNDHAKKLAAKNAPAAPEQEVSTGSTPAGATHRPANLHPPVTGTQSGTRESISYEELYEKVFGEKQAPAEVKGNESNLTEALTKIKNSLMVMISPKEKGLGVDSKFIGDILSQTKTPEGKDAIKNLYKEVSRFLIGDKSHELTVDALYKESMDVIKDKNKVVVVAEKIARFTKRSLQFEGENLYGGMGEFGKELEMYNTTLNQIMGTFKSKPDATEEAPEQTTESMIFESDMTNQSKMGGWLSKFIGIKVGDEALNKTNVKVKGDGNTVIIINGKELENLDGIISDSKDKTQEAVDSLTKEYGDQIDAAGKTYVLDGIEIVRIFNKVNRLIVRGRVPSVRSGGKLTTMKANEWEMISKDAEGDAPNPETGEGPVRNRRLFQQWNDGVLELIKKYDVVLKNAKILNKDGDQITPPYPIAKFMNDALNDMKLFRSMSGRGDGGYQWQYLESHLGLSVEDLKSAGLDDKVKQDKTEGVKGDDNVPEVTAKSTKWSAIEEGKLKDGCFYKIKVKPGSKFAGLTPDTLYFLCMKEANGKLLFKASLSDAFAKPYYHTYAPQTKAGVSKNVYKTTLNLKDVGTSSKINGKCKFVKDDKEFEYKFGIRSIEMLVDENGSPVNRKEVIGLKVNPEYDAGINPTKDVNDRTIAGIISESVAYVSEPKVFRKYSDIVKNGKYN